jgi:hypothetical protein
MKNGIYSIDKFKKIKEFRKSKTFEKLFFSVTICLPSFFDDKLYYYSTNQTEMNIAIDEKLTKIFHKDGILSIFTNLEITFIN